MERSKARAVSRAVIRAAIGPALLLAAGAAAWGQGAVALTVDRADLERVEQGVAFVVAGAAPDVPDRARVRVVLRLGDGDAAQQFVEVGGGRFTARLGPYKRRVLPGTYEAVASIDSSVQRETLAERLSALRVAPATRSLQVGTPEEAAAEREKLRRRYLGVLEDLRMLKGALDQWGSAVTVRTMAARRTFPREVPAREVRAVEREWTSFSDDQLVPGLAAVRFDLQQLGEYVLISYFPTLEPVLAELITSLDRMHAAFTLAIYGNLGQQPPREAAAKGGFSLDELRRNVGALAAAGYAALGAPPQEWRLIDGNVPERLEDAQGDLFRSTVAKFEVKKPAGWAFDVSPVRPTVRLRILPPGQEFTGKVAAGIELHDHPMADSFDELAALDEAMVRNTHPGFELKKARRLRAPDPTMPGGVRPGLELRFRSTQGGKRYAVIQYALFCRWHKRTYALVCIAEEGLEGRFEPLFTQMCESLKVLDAPHQRTQDPGGR